jgi:hypothetical protein
MMIDTSGLGLCQCCRHEPAFGVASIPGVPISITWCVTCIQTGVMPIDVLATTCAINGGDYDEMAEWWLDGYLAPSLHHFDVSLDRFDVMVHEIIADFEAMDH